MQVRLWHLEGAAEINGKNGPFDSCELDNLMYSFQSGSIISILYHRESVLASITRLGGNVNELTRLVAKLSLVSDGDVLRVRTPGETVTSPPRDKLSYNRKMN